MNAPHPLQQSTLALTQANLPHSAGQDDEINLVQYWDIIVDNRWLIAAVTALAVTAGAAYAFLANPVYESNLLIQVEDSAASAKSFLGEAASLFDVKTPATAEIEIIRSRMVIGRAVDKTLLYIDAKPRYLPLLGNWMARRASGLSTPVNGWVRGNEFIRVTVFNVPPAMEGTAFRLVTHEGGSFTLAHPEMGIGLKGTVGTPLTHTTAAGTLTLHVTELHGKPGAEFDLTRHARLSVVEDLQKSLKLAEKGRQSGVINAVLQGTERESLTLILNEIGQQYVRQNVERKAAEAEKTLAFLDVQLPQFKKQLDQSEEAYNQYRNQKGTVALDEEARLVLAQSVELQSKLVDAQQKRRELVARFTGEHPTVATLDDQIGAWKREIAALNTRIKGLPGVQQDAVRLERDMKVNNELYQQLRNNALQLQLIREGKIGNVRLIDPAATPADPVKPRKTIALGLALLLGLAAGVTLALARNAFFRGIRNAHEIEAHTGLNVYCTIPLSKAQEAIASKVAGKLPGLHLLAEAASDDVAVESLRSLRTALQFAMLEAHNNRVLITGATPGIGKSFISANLAAVLAASGKRVLLIDADLRRGHLNQYFGIPRENGLSELILGSIQLDVAIRRALIPNLDVIPTGVLPPNPSELLITRTFPNLLEKLSPNYDVVVIDTAPVLVAADTPSVAVEAGTLLLVARAGQSYVGDLLESARRLAHAGRRANGAILNGIDITRPQYGSNGHKYGGYRYREYSYKSA